MRKLLFPIVCLMISLFFIKCHKEQSNEFSGNGTNSIKSPIIATVLGTIVDENEAPAMGVVIKVGTKTTTTNDKGYFRINNALVDKNASLVIAEKMGYFKSYRTFKVSSGANRVSIKLIKKSLIGTIPSTGGIVTLSNGSSIELPANSVVKVGGINYDGNIQVYANYIDPTAKDIYRKIPGSLMADDLTKKRVLLTSYGMLAVELESTSGEKLQIAEGKTATLSSLIPASIRSTAPSAISMWFIEEATGIWKEEGKATKIGNNYSGTVKHFSFWNCDVSTNTVNISLTLKNKSGDPLMHVPVVLERMGAIRGFAHGYTDSLGQVNGLVPQNEPLKLIIWDPCNMAVDSISIGPFQQDTNMGVITIDDHTFSTTIKGRLLSCNGAPVSNGYPIVYNEKEVNQG